MTILSFSTTLRATGLTCALLAASTALTPAQAACEFSVIKQQIDMVLDQDAEKAAKFHREVASGSDSLTVIETVVSADMREKLDICRYEASEYLAKRGFPPGGH